MTPVRFSDTSTSQYNMSAAEKVREGSDRQELKW
jgi:hypothetical protein